MQNRACITSNCGNLSFYFCENREYDHPFIGCLFVIDEFYVKLCENFDHYMSIEPTCAPPNENSIWAMQNGEVWYNHNEIQKHYPVMFIDDIEIHWIHEHDSDELLNKYNRRRERYLQLKPNKMFFWSDCDMMNDHELQKYNELIYRFTSLDNSIFITRYEKIARFYENAHLVKEWVNASHERNESHQPLIHFIGDRVGEFKKYYAAYPFTTSITNVKKREYMHVANDFSLENAHFSNENTKEGDYTCNVFYVSEHECCVSIIRHDDENGWKNDLKLVLENEIIKIPPSRKSFARIFCIMKTLLTPIIENEQKISKVIVQTNETNLYKNQYDFLSQKSVLEANPEYEYVFFDSKARRIFMRNNFDDKIVEAYDTLVAGAFQADIFRIAYLYIMGGCYLDFKVIERQPLRCLINHDDDLIVCCDYERSNNMNVRVETSYLNAVIFSEPKSEKLHRVLRACVDNVLNNQKYFEEEMTVGGCSRILSITGPCLLYNILRGELSTKQLRLKHIIVNNDEMRYDNFRIVSLLTGEYIFTKTHMTYAYKNRYDELWFRREIFYRNACRAGDFLIYVYPHPYNDTFSFYITNDGFLYVYRHQNEGWGLNLRLKIVNDITSEIQNVTIGNSSSHIKSMRFDFLYCKSTN